MNIEVSYKVWVASASRMADKHDDGDYDEVLSLCICDIPFRDDEDVVYF